MSNYEYLSCPVPFKLENVYSVDEDFDKDWPGDDYCGSGFYGIELLFRVNDFIHRGNNLPIAERIFNGWVLGNKLFEYKHPSGLYLYTSKLIRPISETPSKDDDLVYIIDESEWADCGPKTISIFSDNKESLTKFKNDFNLVNKIKVNTYCKQCV
ncbi:MAG: hypothetical protein WC523_04965 [Patescibacteria group bacterium]